ncbi:hypothetical protein FRC98_20095 [Lujinxingia vulgaris]|uniref:Uncharacterized protein n=1 Tax=Lujinxingia vulgaris TaxID=2600176 RepID=A0A5C6WYS3_9DELT|nr:hypothetical protein [Lujinxingia vulgaris]TXD33901.1 hypothetical protein FRC98_20095 [Lujinxingia vulgaris]
MTLPKHARTTLALLTAMLLSTGGCSPAFDDPDTTDHRRSESLHQTPALIDTPTQTTTCRDAGVELGVLRSERWVACQLDLSHLSTGGHTFTQSSDFLANGEVCAELLDLSLELYPSAQGPALAWTSLNDRNIDALFIQGANAGNLYTYRPTVDSDEGVHAPPDGASWADIDNVSFCVERALTAHFSLVPGSVGPYDWHIKKVAAPELLELGPDASGEVDYKVIVSATDIGPREIFVEGVAYITNTTAADAHIESATIEVEGLVGELDCDVNFPHALQSQSGLECTYLLTGFGESQNESIINALLTIEVSDESPTRGARATQSTLLSVPPLDALDRVIVRDGDDIRAPCPFDAQPCIFEYTRTFECPFDQGIDAREARLTDTDQTARAPVKIDCAETDLQGQLLVQTFADASFHGAYVWTIEKSANPALLELGPNASGEVTYTLNVSARDTGESYYVVEGFVRVLNLTEFDAEMADISVMVGQREAIVDCDAPFPITIFAGANRVCAYTIEDIDPTETAVETRVEVTPTSVVGGVIGQGDISYDSRPPESLETVQVRALVDGIEVLDEPCHWQQPCTFEYTRTFSCPLDEGAYFDSAYLPATGQSADARIDVVCEDAEPQGELRIQSAALTSYTRTYRWTIDATARHEQLLLQPGQTTRVDYLAIITGQDHVDSNHLAQGPVYITNPTEFDALIESVTTRAGDTPGSVDCGLSFPYLLQAGRGLECTQTISNLSGNEPRSEVLVKVDPTSEVLGGVSRWNLDWGPPTTHLFRDVTVRAEVEGVRKIEQNCSWDSGCTLQYSASFRSPHDEGPQVSTITIVEPGLEQRVSIDVVCKGH